MGKGSRQRPSQIDKYEEGLRYELAFETQDNELRKEEILKELKEIAEEKRNGISKN